MIRKKKLRSSLTIAALGVVFGDIGTSPLYALQVTLGNQAVTLEFILGILSLIFWSLIIIISIKYLALVFRADNEGEGGILALLALLKQKNLKHVRFFYLIAIFGAGLLLGDGMLTPAISVMSASEGLTTIFPNAGSLVFYFATIVLFFIFFLQSKGTGKIGAIFGPCMLVWFVVIALLGLREIIENPVVWHAMNPYYALHFLYDGGWRSFFLLGGIFLVVTGGEALYADIGHFGKNPIRYAWFVIVFPALILSYFGQGAYLLNHPGAGGNAFFMMAPAWFGLPLFIISTIATIIASQAVIAATFSLAKQAVLLGLCPRIQIIQTSLEHSGQIYVPQVNNILFLGTFTLLFAFGSSAKMAHAYGIAVNFDMLLITIMVAYAALQIWQWPFYKIVTVFSIFFMIDTAFLLANTHKFLTGGWLPVVFALCIGYLMSLWSSCLEYLKENFYRDKIGMQKVLKQINYKFFNHLKGVTSVFVTDIYDESGGSFLQYLKLSLSVPEHVLIVSYVVENRPHVHYQKRYEVLPLNDTVCRLILHYGFMDTISIPGALKRANSENVLPFAVPLDDVTYVVDLPNIVVLKKQENFLLGIKKRIFAFLMRNYSANLNMEFYNLPYNRTMVIGSYYLF